MKTTLITISILLFTKSIAQSSFTIEGKKYACKVSTQEFVNKNFSVLCEWEDRSSSGFNKWKYELFQLTFHSEAEVNKGGVFKIASSETINKTGYSTIVGNGKLFICRK